MVRMPIVLMIVGVAAAVAADDAPPSLLDFAGGDVLDSARAAQVLGPSGLFRGLADDDPRIRFLAARALRESHDGCSALDALAGVISQHDPDVAAEATAAAYGIAMHFDDASLDECRRSQDGERVARRYDELAKSLSARSDLELAARAVATSLRLAKH